MFTRAKHDEGARRLMSIPLLYDEGPSRDRRGDPRYCLRPLIVSKGDVRLESLAVPFENYNRNEFFTYFTTDKGHTSHRDGTQIWNSGGYIIKIQGSDWKGAYNGFAKRHLIATAGGKNSGDADAKMMMLNSKRAANPAQRRQPKFNAMVSAVAPLPTNMRDPAVRAQYASDKVAAETNIRLQYKTDPYGPQTSVVTVIILDGMSQAEIATKIADGIAAKAPWADGDEKHVLISVPGRVKTVETDKSVTMYDNMRVKVKLAAGIHHVYHCDGGV